MTSPSAVSQEMELLYWKDIQDSADPEGFAGFLSQFPVGVYAGLAQRQLRRLASATSERTDSQSLAGPSISSMQARLNEASASAGMHGSAMAQLGPALAPAATDAAAPPTGTGLETDRQPFETTRAPPPPARATPAIDDEARAARRAQASREEDDRNAQQARRIAELRWIGPLRAAAPPPGPVGSDLQASPREPEVAGAPALRADPAPTSEPAFAHAEGEPPPSPPAPVAVANANAIATRAVKLRSVTIVAIAAAFALLGGGAWLALRDRGQPPVEATPVTATNLPESASVVASAVPDTLPPARPESPSVAAPSAVTEPAASAASASFAADSGPTLVRAKAEECADLGTAVASYVEIANGIDRKAAAGAARRLWELHRDGGKGMVSKPEQAQRWYDRARKLGARLPVWPADPTGPTAPTAPAALGTTLIVALAPVAASSAAAPLATVKATPAELYERGKKLEARSPRLAEAAYRDAAQQGHGPSQKRMWELQSGSGRAADAGRYQKDAWDQNVAGVPKPKEAP